MKGYETMSNLSNSLNVTRRSFLAATGAAAAAIAGLGLAGCSDNDAPAGSTGTDTANEEQAVAMDTKAYDKLIASGAVADASAIAGSTWASAVSEAGTLRVGGVQTSLLFSQLNEKDNVLRGFDAGLSQLLARYIVGDETKIDNTQVTSDTRESVLQNDQVDVVFATYSITDDRKKVISFAGPYFVAQQAILVLKDNTDINSVDDLDGKTVAVQSGSTGPSIVKKYAPKATQQ